MPSTRSVGSSSCIPCFRSASEAVDRECHSPCRNDGGPFIELTIDNVQNRSYPLSREVYLYTNREAGRPLDPKVKEFLRYILSQEGQEAVMRDGKYLPIDERDGRG